MNKRQPFPKADMVMLNLSLEKARAGGEIRTEHGRQRNNPHGKTVKLMEHNPHQLVSLRLQ